MLGKRKDFSSECAICTRITSLTQKTSVDGLARHLSPLNGWCVFQSFVLLMFSLERVGVFGVFGWVFGVCGWVFGGVWVGVWGCMGGCFGGVWVGVWGCVGGCECFFHHDTTQSSNTFCFSQDRTRATFQIGDKDGVRIFFCAGKYLWWIYWYKEDKNVKTRKKSHRINEKCIQLASSWFFSPILGHRCW